MRDLTGRVLQITLYKCGSQWLRDVLTAPEVVAYSGFVHSGVTLSMAECGNLDIPEHTFSGPIYDMNQWEWQYWKRPGDKAVVALRDPRDRLISLQYSLLYSHGLSVAVEFWRPLLHALPDADSRLACFIYQPRFSGAHRMYRTWQGGGGAEVIVTRYEALLADQHAEFRKIVDWLGWEVPNAVLDAVVDRLSFEVRSGRMAGQTDIHSHYRRGVVGDWRNHFKREHGELWERLYPGLLRELGYEDSDDWWRSLSEIQAGGSNISAEPLTFFGNNDGLIKTLEMQLRQAQDALAAKENMIQELSSACIERQAIIDELKQACDARSNLIERLAKGGSHGAVG